MNVNDIFMAAADHYTAAVAAHQAAVDAGQQPAPPINGVTLFATMYYGDTPRKYSIKGYRLIGKSQVSLAAENWIEITPKNLDAAAKKAGYTLAYPPHTGHVHQLVYRGVDPAQPPSGYTAHGDQWAQHNAKKMREAAIMAAGTVAPVEQRIKVVNVKGMTPNAPGIWYCGREWAGWQAGVLANGNHETADSREVRVQKFADDLWEDVQRQGPLYAELRKMQQRLETGETVALGCWCAPKACHCDRIRNGLLWLLKNQPQPPTEPIAQAEPPAQKPRIEYRVASDAPVPTDPKEMRQHLAALGWDKKDIANMLRMKGRAQHIIQHGITPDAWQAVLDNAMLLHEPPVVPPAPVAPPAPPAPVATAKPPYNLAIGCDSTSTAVQQLLRKEIEVSRTRLTEAGLTLFAVAVSDKRAQGLLIIHDGKSAKAQHAIQVFAARDLPVREVKYNDDFAAPAAPPQAKKRTPAALPAAVTAKPSIAPPAVNFAARAAAAASAVTQSDENAWPCDIEE